jgi:hypothetical protein
MWTLATGAPPALEDPTRIINRVNRAKNRSTIILKWFDWGAAHYSSFTSWECSLECS